MDSKDFLPYYDVEEGIGRLRGNKALYARLVSSYISKLSLDQFMSAYESKDMEKAKAEIHTIKGAAANLSMNGIYHLSQEVETLVKNEEEISDKYAELKECLVATVAITPSLLEFLKS